MKVNSIRINAIEGPISRIRSRNKAKKYRAHSNAFMYVIRCAVRTGGLLPVQHTPFFEYVDRVCGCAFLLRLSFICKTVYRHKIWLDHPVSASQTDYRLLLQFNSLRCRSVGSSKLFSCRIICIHIFQSAFYLSLGCIFLARLSPF